MRTQSLRLRCIAVAGLLSIATVALPGTAHAWSVHVGVLGGVGLSKLSGLDSPGRDFQGLTGPCYGVTVRLPINAVFAIQPEVLAVTDGISFGESERTDESGNVLGKLESLHVLDRIQVPVVIRYSPPSGLRAQPFVFAGTYTAMRVREYDRSTGSIEITRTNEVLKATEFGATVGGGVQMKLGPGSIELQARYDAGLTDLGDYRGLGSPRTSAFRILLGYN